MGAVAEVLLGIAVLGGLLVMLGVGDSRREA